MGAPACPVAFEGVEFSYRGTAVLKGVDLTVVEGEMCAIIGDNGAGKNSLLAERCFDGDTLVATEVGASASTRSRLAWQTPLFLSDVL